MSLTDMTIERRGGGNPVVIRGNDVSASWEVNHAGILSASLQVEQLTGLGLTVEDLLSRWVRWEHPEAGVWAGQITGVEVAERRTVVLSGETFHSLFKQKFNGLAQASRSQPEPAASGALFKRMLADARASTGGTNDDLYLTTGTISESGPNLEVDWVYADFYQDIIPALTEEIDHEYRVSPDRVVSYGRWLGRDRSSVVKLAEGHEIVSWSLTRDREALSNILVGYGTYAARYRGREAEFEADIQRVFEPASVARHGVLGLAVDYGQVKNKSAIKEFIKDEGRRLLNPSFPLTAQLTPIRGEWRQFAESDVVRVVLASAGVEGDLRVMVRAYDGRTGTMSISGDFWPNGFPNLPVPYTPFIPPEPKPGKGDKKKRKKKRRRRGR